MTFTKEQIEQIRQAAQTVIDITTHEAAIADALDNPEYLASEIIALTEWCSASIEHNANVARKVLELYSWPQGVAVEVKVQFNLPY